MTPDVETLRRELEDLRSRNADLRSRNRELEQTLDAIRSGEVDAIVVSKGETSQVYALEGADHPYRVLVEKIQEGALTVTATGMVLYANAAFAAMRGLPLSAILGTPLRDHLAPRDRAQVDALLEASRTGAGRGEMSVCSGTATIPVQVSMTPLEVDSDVKISVVVTDRRQDYGRLRLQGRMLDSVADAVAAVDPDGTIIYWNEAAERLYGRTAAEMVGRSMTDATEFGVTEAEARQVFAELKAGLVWSGESMARHRDGRSFPVLATRAPVYDESGALVAVIATSRDISERIAAEEAIRESEARQAYLLQLSDALRPLADPVEVQSAAARILGEHFGADRVAYFEVDGSEYVVGRDYAPSIPGMAGRHPVASFGPRLLAAYRSGATAVGEEVEDDPGLSDHEKAAFGAVRSGAYISVPLVKAGELVARLAVHMATPRRWTPEEIALIEETAERTWAAVGRVRAEAERKRLLAEVGHQRARLQTVLDSLPLGVWITDAAGAMVVVNEIASEIYGGEAPVVDRVDEYDVYRVWRADTGERVASDAMPLARALAGETVTDEVLDFERFDGTRGTQIASAAPLRDAGGTITGSVAIVMDISRLREAEAALQENAENLQRSNEDLQRFAYVASHDLQEPLRSIVSFSQLLARRYRGKLGEDADDYIEFIVEGGNRMQGLIQDLLAYSRVNTTRQELRPTDTEEVLAAVERNLDVQLREAGAVLTRDPMPATVLADPLQLEQVLMNLVSNAIKFHRPDEPLQIHVGARRLDGFWEFSVADNGIGIEKEYFDRIFVIFQRLHTKETYPGTGIGLAIVKRIIDRHGGTVRVESTPGEGTTFFFTLPAA